MNHVEDGSLRFSPTDLIAFLEGDFASWCDRRLVEQSGPGSGSGREAAFEPDSADPELDLLKRKGTEHERRFLDELKGSGREVVDLTGHRRDPGPTLDAMQAGAQVIYQPFLRLDPIAGYPDFLFRVRGDSSLGAWQYEPWDTKLALSAKPYFLIQLSAYAEMLEAAQRARPRELAFVLGSRERLRFPTDDFFYYYLELKRSFLEFQARWDPALPPDPGLDRSWGRWMGYAEHLLETADHLSRVANISRSQIKRLNEADVLTMAALAAAGGLRVPGIAPQVLERLRLQAGLQLESAGRKRPSFLPRPRDPTEPRRGLALLPPPSRLDVFFDMEGFPFAEGGLEYLFGATVLDSGNPDFHDWWAHDPAEEKRALEGFVDWAHARWREDPAMHIYHYAGYEKSALRRLMGKYATREDEVDDLLRHEVLVDLYTVVRQGLLIGTPSYSLKDVERAYAEPRSGEVTTAAGSVIEYQRWIDSGEPRDWRASPILSAIRDYNRVDCDSTWQLRDWLLERQKEQGVEYRPPAAPDSTAAEAPEEAPVQPAAALRELLEQRIIEGRIPDAEAARVTQLLAWLLEFHRREEKPMWWRMFDRAEASEEELYDDQDCLAGLVRTETPPFPIKRKFGLEYRFDPDQDTKLHAGDKVFASHDLTWRGEIVEMDGDTGRVVVKTGRPALAANRLNLIPDEFVSADVIKEALLRFVSAWAEGKSPSRAVDDLLYRRPPRVTGHAGGPLIAEGQDTVGQAVELAARLDGTTLCIQGPPGTGKTYTAAAIIASLLRNEKSIGVTSNSHKAIVNLMNAVVDALGAEAGQFRLVKVGNPEDAEGARTPIQVAGSKDAGQACGSGGSLFGGTAWFFSREEVRERFDYLFVDEAGQVSLANLVAIGSAARNIVLVGDQMQLAQPTQGSHPGESGRSCLDYLLNGHATIPSDFGIFLGESRRLHPDVCRFISDAVYEGRLGSNPQTRRQRIVIPDGARIIRRETGVVFVPVEHDGNAQSSPEEVTCIEAIVGDLLGRAVFDQAGGSHSLTLEGDILLVTPYNMQVRSLKAALGPAARVGSVDKFQGQEAPVVIVSLASSSLEDAPRGADFLLNRNRLNVAVSRAQALAIVVASPALLAPRCRTIEEMRLVNLLCRLRHYAEEGTGRRRGE